MTQVALQVGRAGSVHKSEKHDMEVRSSLDTAGVTLAVGAQSGVTGVEVDMTGQDQSHFLVVHTDEAAGELTITLEHATDVATADWTAVTDDALMRIGEVDTVPAASVVIDYSVAANQKTHLIAIGGSARELSGGAFVSELKGALRLSYATDGAWSGADVFEVGIGSMLRHQPGPSAD